MIFFGTQPTFVNETGRRQEILVGAYINEQTYPLLTLATATSITATTTIPQVTVTF